MGQVNRLKFAEYHPKTDIALIEQYWRGLLKECPHHYFLSWGWMSTWLNSLPAEHGVRLVVGFQEDKNEPVLAFFCRPFKQEMDKTASH